MTEHSEPNDSGDDAAEPNLIAEAIQLARRLQERANVLQTPQEKRQQAEFDRMIQHPADKATLVQMTDQAFRSSASRRAADQLTEEMPAGKELRQVRVFALKVSMPESPRGEQG